jgi:integrase
MLNHGVPILVVSKRLGHAQPSITFDVYGHLIPSMQEQAAVLMDAVFTPIKLDEVAQVAPGLHRSDL